ICLKNDIIRVSDEIYSKVVYTNDKHISIAQLSPELKKQTVDINSVSKSHAMTGRTIGYAAGTQYIIKAMDNLVSHATSNEISISQYATLAAYEAEIDPTVKMRDIFADRLDTLYNLLTNIPGISCDKPNGAFYLFPNVKEAVKMNGFNNTDDWVKALLEDEKVALVPGTGFGDPNNVRLSNATSKDELIEEAKRIERFVAKNKK